MIRKVSVFGALNLLGQHLLAQISAHPGLGIASLHDSRYQDAPDTIPWLAGIEGRRLATQHQILAPSAAATGEIILSFLADPGAEQIEAAHLRAGAKIISHCEYARKRGVLVIPHVLEPVLTSAPLIATPNCTTAMCALPLSLLHARHGIAAAHITTLQAVSGTDLPGMQAYQIHDQVVSDLPGEARALQEELSHVFSSAFPVNCVATRVPVWRGHTISLTIKLADAADAASAIETLSNHSRIALIDQHRFYPRNRQEIGTTDLLCTIEGIRDGQDGWITMSLRGDNLEAATTGLMLEVASML